jgi:hypothetical protein
MSSVRNTRSPLKVLGLFLGGIAAGAAAGFIVGKQLWRLHLSLKTLTWSDFAALGLGVAFLGVAVIIVFNSANRKRLARLLEGKEATLPATADEVTTFRAQAITLALAGLMLMLPVLASQQSVTNVRLLVMLVIFGLFTAQVLVNIRLWQMSDEFVRGMMLTIGAITFAIGQGCLFLYAAAERLGLVRTVSGWNTIVALLTLYFVVNSVVSIRQTQR